MDVEDVVVEVDGEGRVVREEEGKKEEEKEEGKKEGEGGKKEEVGAVGEEQQRHRAGFRELFVFSIAAPRAIVAVE